MCTEDIHKQKVIYTAPEDVGSLANSSSEKPKPWISLDMKSNMCTSSIGSYQTYHFEVGCGRAGTSAR